MNVLITDEMRNQASIEAKRRDHFIKHHFEVGHLTSQQRDELGFIGEFACCSVLGIDWKQNIREDYRTIDDFDLILKGKKVDVKTETVPERFARKIISRTIRDDEPYGRRLVNHFQFNLLSKYDLVIFGLLFRNTLDYWYPVGYIESHVILSGFPPTSQRPDGRGDYDSPASPVPTSILKPITDLL